LAKERLSELLQRLEGYSGPQKALPASLDKFIEPNDNINAIDQINQIQELVAVKLKYEYYCILLFEVLIV